jgi:hypothetical protein
MITFIPKYLKNNNIGLLMGLIISKSSLNYK